MNRNLRKKNRISVFDVFISLMIIWFIIIFWLSVRKNDPLNNEEAKKTYTQKTIDSLITIIKDCKSDNESYYNRIIQLEQNLDTIKNSLNNFQGTVTKLKTKKNEKNTNTNVIIYGEIPKFLPNRYN